MKNSVVSEKGEYLQIYVLGILRLDIEKLVDQLTEPVEEEFIFFAVENISDHVWDFKTRDFRFVSTEDFMYEPSLLKFSQDELPSGWYSNSVKIEPQAKARIILTLGHIPDNESIKIIIYDKEAVRNRSEKIHIEINKGISTKLEKFPDERV